MLEAAFWERFRQLPLDDMGMTSEEVSSMHDFVDWSDGEGLLTLIPR